MQTRDQSRLLNPLVRALMESLIWLPVWLIATDPYAFGVRIAIFFAAVGVFLIGRSLSVLSVVWRRGAISLAIVFVLAGGIALSPNDWPLFVWLAVLIWRGRYPRLGPAHYGLAFLLCAAGVIAITQIPGVFGYRAWLIFSAIVWIIAWFVAYNRSLLDEAGLRIGIATRSVRRANRKYLLLFLAAGLLVFALTARFGQQLLTPTQIDFEGMPKEPDVIERPPAMDNPQSFLPPAEENPWLSRFWDILSWIVGGLAAIGLLWLAVKLWRNRSWTWRGLLESIRKWYLREKKFEQLPYIEERRSLAKDRNNKPGLWETLFHRQGRGADWSRLSNPEKVRRLYEEAVLSGIERGYSFHSNHTPSETLEAIEHWRTDRPASDKEAAYWRWFRQVRQSLLRLYEKAKYSPHAVTDREVESLTESRPDRKHP